MIRNYYPIVLIVFTFLVTDFTLQGQAILENGEDTISVQSLPPADLFIDAGAMSPPARVIASDGDFSDRIKIQWSITQEGALYKVFRGETPNINEMEEISRGWKRSNWMLDYLNLEPNKKYYYRVIAALNESQVSLHSSEDSGYISLMETMAYPNIQSNALTGELRLLNTTETIAEGDDIEVYFILHNTLIESMHNVSVQFELQGEEFQNLPSKLLYEEEIGTIDAGAFVRRTARFPAPTVEENYNVVLRTSVTDGEMFLEVAHLSISKD